MVVAVMEAPGVMHREAATAIKTRVAPTDSSATKPNLPPWSYTARSRNLDILQLRL